MNVYSKEPPVLVSYDDPKHRNKIITQFMVLEGKFKALGLAKFILSLLDLLTGELYLRFDQSFYYFPKQNGVNYRYALTELPGQQFTTAPTKTPFRMNK